MHVLNLRCFVVFGDILLFHSLTYDHHTQPLQLAMVRPSSPHSYLLFLVPISSLATRRSSQLPQNTLTDPRNRNRSHAIPQRRICTRTRRDSPTSSKSSAALHGRRHRRQDSPGARGARTTLRRCRRA